MRAAAVFVGMLILSEVLFGQVAEKTPATRNETEPFDIVIVNGHIIDGTGSPWYSGQVGIRAGHIAAIGNLEASPRRQTIDAHGDVVAPGFIDMLGQSELTMLVDPRLPSKIYQGITTEITGEGNSAAPVNESMIANDRAGYDHLKINPDWIGFRQYFARLEHQGMGINLASYVGATSVRRMVLGRCGRAADGRTTCRYASAGAGGDARWRGWGVDGSPVFASALRQDRGVDCFGNGGREVRRNLCHPHAQRGRCGV
jgi:hypothetical protein